MYSYDKPNHTLTEEEKKTKDYTLDRLEPTKIEFYCPENELDIDHYRVLLDGNIIDNNIYLELGYNEDTEYDSGYFLSVYHALELAHHIIKVADIVMRNNERLSKSIMTKKEIEALFQTNRMKSIEILPLYANLCISEPMFGSMNMDVKYTDIDDNTNHVILTTDPYKYKDLMKYETLERDLLEKYSNLEKVIFDNEKFKSLMNELKKINDEYIKEQEEATGDISPVKQAKLELQDIAREVIKKIEENNGDN